MITRPHVILETSSGTSAVPVSAKGRRSCGESREGQCVGSHECQRRCGGPRESQCGGSRGCRYGRSTSLTGRFIHESRRTRVFRLHSRRTYPFGVDDDPTYVLGEIVCSSDTVP